MKGQDGYVRSESGDRSHRGRRWGDRTVRHPHIEHPEGFSGLDEGLRDAHFTVRLEGDGKGSKAVAFRDDVSFEHIGLRCPPIANVKGRLL